MKRNQLPAAALLIAFGATAFGLGGGGDDYDMNWFTIDSGGGISFGDDFEVHGTIGQHDAGPLLAAGDFTLAGGFWAGGSGDPGSEIAALFDFQIITGALLGGGLPELQSSDDTYLRTRSGFGDSFIDLHHMEIKVLASTTIGNPTTIDLTVETRIDDSAGTAQVRMFNWNTNQYEVIGQHPLGLNDAVRVFAGLDANDYVSNLGEIDVKMKHIVFVPFVAYTFQSFFDQVEIAVNE